MRTLLMPGFSTAFCSFRRRGVSEVLIQRRISARYCFGLPQISTQNALLVLVWRSRLQNPPQKS
jgi:hypothetical protein